MKSRGKSHFKSFLVGLCTLVSAVSICSEPVNAETQDKDTCHIDTVPSETTGRFAKLQKEAIDLINGYRDKEAEQKFLEIIRLLNRVSGENSDTVCRTKNNLAVLYTEMHKYQEAESLLTSNLLSAEKIFGNESIQLVEILKSLGVVYTRSDKYEAASKSLSRALSIVKKKSKEADPLLLAYIADLKSSQGLYREALEFCEEALKAIGKAPIKDAELLTDIQSCQAGTYLEIGALNKARELYSQNLSSKMALKGDQDPSVADAKIDMAFVFFRLGKVATAQILISQALPIQKRTYGEFSVEVAKTLSLQSDLALAEGETAEAKELIVKSIAIREHILGSGHTETATGLAKLAKIELIEKNLADSEAHCLQSIKIDRYIAGELHPAYANDLTILASIYHEQGRPGLAKSLYGQAIAILSKALPSDSPDLISIKTAYKTLLKIKANRRDTANQHLYFR